MGHEGLHASPAFRANGYFHIHLANQKESKALLPNNGDSFLRLGDCDVTVHVCDQGPGLVVTVMS